MKKTISQLLKTENVLFHFFLTIQARKTFHKIPLTQFMPILCGLYNTFLNICIALALFSPLAIIIFKQVLMRVNWLKN